MSEPVKDGGRAFPCDQIVERDAKGHLHGLEVSSGGMTLRGYFIAHAPAEPQPWFEPTMPERRPTPVWITNDGRFKSLDLRVMEREHFNAYSMQNQKEFDAWGTEFAKQRYVQWPAAWADEMLKARSS